MKFLWTLFFVAEAKIKALSCGRLRNGEQYTGCSSRIGMNEEICVDLSVSTGHTAVFTGV